MFVVFEVWISGSVESGPGEGPGGQPGERPAYAGSSAAEWADNGLDQKECVHGALLLTAGPGGHELL